MYIHLSNRFMLIEDMFIEGMKINSLRGLHQFCSFKAA